MLLVILITRTRTELSKRYIFVRYFREQRFATFALRLGPCVFVRLTFRTRLLRFICPVSARKSILVCFLRAFFTPLRGKRKHWRNNNQIYVRITRNKISPAENIRDDYFDARKKEAKLNKAREREKEKERKKKVESKGE